MKINKKTIFIGAIILCLVLCFLSFLSGNELIMGLSTFAIAILGLTAFVLQASIRIKLIKEIKNNNLFHINVRENNNFIIIFQIIVVLNLLTSIKKRYEIYQLETPNPSNNVIVFLKSISSSDNLVMAGVILVIILFILTIIQVLFNKSIISNDKIIFYDGIVFEIDEIDDIEYTKSYIYKNKKVIKLGKGLIDRKIMIDTKDFEKVKNILDAKIKS